MSRVLGSLIIVLLVWSSAMAEPSCPKVISEVAPCLSFLRDDGPAKPSKRCCEGVTEVNGIAKTKQDRIAICECLKQTLNYIDYDPKRIPLLGKQCGLTIDLPPTGQNTNCSQVAY
ncbi:hypothetical protein PVL29_020211 [Vitis rotundifolia]|uniref:Bifunctional inhibitor/plant lipid transfer protein/seed storage helical domain-containing protein n=1 Tax=Vitis rotundifolia TaxID=103349 RepID=A0AA38Z338_VITRO|nr:hypothetical protein PVL29_020211 [Vitis rotundifolia]